MSQNRLRWIHSGGGPLVLLQHSTLPLWQGVEGDDYAAACSVRGYTGVLMRHGRDALVLADEPLETAYHESGAHRFLVQWSFAPDEVSVTDALAALPSTAVEPLQEVSFDIVDDRQILMDAATPRGEAREHLALSLAPGHYAVRTLAYRPSADVELILHELLLR